MEPPHRHAYLHRVPCDLHLGDYFISVDTIDDFEPVDGDCISLIVNLNVNISVDTQTLLPCPIAWGLEGRRAYASFLKETLTGWFLFAGLPQDCIDCLAKEMMCFVLFTTSKHRCPSQRPQLMSVPQVTITHTSVLPVGFLETVPRALKRATDESIEALEMVRAAELDGNPCKGSCVICLEDFDVMVLGESIARMPCSHVFHKDCIVEWLKINSCMCPLCRFEMPTMEVLN